MIDKIAHWLASTIIFLVCMVLVSLPVMDLWNDTVVNVIPGVKSIKWSEAFDLVLLVVLITGSGRLLNIFERD